MAKVRGKKRGRERERRAVCFLFPCSSFSPSHSHCLSCFSFLPVSLSITSHPATPFPLSLPILTISSSSFSSLPLISCFSRGHKEENPRRTLPPSLLCMERQSEEGKVPCQRIRKPPRHPRQQGRVPEGSPNQGFYTFPSVVIIFLYF